MFDILPWDNKWYKVYNGYWDKTYTGLAENEYGWWYVKNGLVDFTYTGLAGNDSGTWYVEDGEVRFDVSGTVTVDGKIYKCDGGLCDVNYTGLVLYNDKWMYLNNNKIDTSFTGTVSNDAGEWYVSNGEVSFDYTGKINYQDKVYHVTNGLVDGYTDFTGVKLVGNQRLYYNEGVFDKSYNGNAKDQDGLQWRVKDGVVVGSVGMDVSNHNGNIDWDAVKADGIQFAIIRLGWGDDVENQDDALAARNISECERIGMPYGLYIYSYALKVEEAQSEVAHSLRFANSCNPTLGVWFDMEDADGYKERHGINVYEERQLLTDFCKIFCDAVSAAGYKTGIYANYNYFKNVLLSDQLQSYDKWLANWGIDEPSIPCEMWQYTSDGSADGISGRLDMNIWYH